MEYIKNNALELCSKILAQNLKKNISTSLLLTGVPGSGKTEFAKQVASDLGAKLFRYDCNEESNSSLMVTYDLDGIITRQAAYIKGALWEAFDETTPTVMLIDEVDKSPRQFEAFLLRATDELSFRSPKGETIEAKNPIIFIFTSNGRREMSPEFLRRNFRINLEYPKKNLLKTIVQGMCNSLVYESQISLVCQTVDTLNGKVEPDQLPSPKELANLLNLLHLTSTVEDVEVLVNGYFLKGMTIAELNKLISFNFCRALWKK